MSISIKQKTYFAIFGILIVAISLSLSNPYVGLIISLLLAAIAFIDMKIGILYLLIFIPVRPFLIVCSEGYKWIGVVIILSLLLQTFINNRSRLNRLFKFHYFELFYLLFCLFGAVVAFYNGVSLGAIIMQLYTFLLFFLLFYVVSRMDLNKMDILLFSATTFMVGIFLSIHGLVEKISNRTLLLPEVWENLELAPTNRIRIYGLIGGPNELALYLILSFIVSLYLYKFSKRNVRVLILIGLFLIQTAFWLTYSRGALLTLFIFIPVYLLFNRSIPYWKQFLLITGISLSVAFLIGKTDFDRYSDAFSDETVLLSKQDGRIYYVNKAIEVFKDKPVTGYGFGTFGGAATQTYSSPIYEKYNISWNFYSDNQYIQILAETGVIGTILILFFVFGIGSIIWKIRSGYFFTPLLVYLYTAAIVGSLVYNTLELDIFTLYFFTVLGYAFQHLPNHIKKS